MTLKSAGDSVVFYLMICNRDESSPAVGFFGYASVVETHTGQPVVWYGEPGHCGVAVGCALTVFFGEDDEFDS